MRVGLGEMQCQAEREILMDMQSQCINIVVIQINSSTKELKVEIGIICYLLEENYDIQIG